MILGDFNTGAVLNRRLVEALRVEVGLIDKGAGNRGASTTKRGTRIDRLLVADQVSARFTAPPQTGDPLSPILFLVFMHELSSRLKEAGHGIHLAGLPIPFFCMQMTLHC
jgi:hypothetical protein